jgi:hypothetical protein
MSRILISSGLFSDLQSAFASCVDGDMIILSGDYVLDTPIVVNYAVSLIGLNNPSISVTSSSMNNKTMFKWNGTSASGLRISGISFDGGDVGCGCIYITTGNHRFRVDNNHFTLFTGRPYLFEGADGLMDNNHFHNIRGEGAVYGGANTAGYLEAWNLPFYFGSDVSINNYLGVVFIEDNLWTFDEQYVTDYGTMNHAIAGNGGCRYVFRHNVVNAYYRNSHQMANMCDLHGSYELVHGGAIAEVYNNTFNTTKSYQGLYFRGGRMRVFNNEFIGTEAHEQYSPNIQRCIALTDYRCWNAPSKPGHGVACAHGYCSVACPDTASNPILESGVEPVTEQITNSYFWNNYYTDFSAARVLVEAEVEDRGHNLVFIQEDRDFFNSEPEGYTPFQYPHPDNVNASGLVYPISIGVDV